MEMTPTTFEVGKTYSCRSVCDYDTIFSFEVVKRTAKFVTLRSSTWGEQRRGVYYWQGVERCQPLGNYSMSPIICADEEVA